MNSTFQKCRLCLKLGDFCSIYEQDNSIKLSEMVMAFTSIQVCNVLLSNNLWLSAISLLQQVMVFIISRFMKVMAYLIVFVRPALRTLAQLIYLSSNVRGLIACSRKLQVCFLLYFYLKLNTCPVTKLMSLSYRYQYKPTCIGGLQRIFSQRVSPAH